MGHSASLPLLPSFLPTLSPSHPPPSLSQLIDKNNDGNIDIEDFSVNGVPHTEKWKEFRRIFDYDCDGRVTPDEVGLDVCFAIHSCVDTTLVFSEITPLMQSCMIYMK